MSSMWIKSTEFFGCQKTQLLFCLFGHSHVFSLINKYCWADDLLLHCEIRIWPRSLLGVSKTGIHYTLIHFCIRASSTSCAACCAKLTQALLSFHEYLHPCHERYARTTSSFMQIKVEPLPPRRFHHNGCSVYQLNFIHTQLTHSHTRNGCQCKSDSWKLTQKTDKV